MRKLNYDFDGLGLNSETSNFPDSVEFSSIQNIDINLPTFFEKDYISSNSRDTDVSDQDIDIFGAEFGPVLSMAGVADIGYYDSLIGTGNSNQVATITAAGHNAVQANTLSAAELSAFDVLIVQNPDNNGFGNEYLNNLANLDSAVSNGMILIVNDRYVAGAAAALPGGSGISFTRAFGSDIEANESSALVAASGGTITDTSLDGGNSSWHGYADPATLPVGAEIILTTANPNEVVMFSYDYGAGTVIYSSIPVDFYLDGGASISTGVIALLTAIADYSADLSGFGANIVQLTPNDDVYRGTDGVDIVDALDGDDVLNGALGDDVLNGQGGNDTFFGSQGGDSFNGGAGVDRVLYSLADSGVTVNFLDTSLNTGQAAGDNYDSIENLYGSAYDDDLTMDAGDSLLNGRAGDDVLDAGAGNDRVYGGTGEDIIIGGTGNDFLNGGSGADVFVFGQGDGDDLISGFEDGLDMLEIAFQPALRADASFFAQLVVTQQGLHTVVEYGNDSITLLYFDAANLTEDDFNFIELAPLIA